MHCTAPFSQSKSVLSAGTASRTLRRFTAVFGAAAGLVLITGWRAAVSIQLAVVGILVSLVLGFLLAGEARGPASVAGSDLIEQSFLIARDADAHEQQRRLARSLARIVQHGDPLFRSLALQRPSQRSARTDERQIPGDPR